MKTLEKELDRKWSAAVKSKAGFRCEQCGSDNVSAHHIISRNHKRLRWNPYNGLCLCFNCHRNAHDYPNRFEKWLKDAHFSRYEALKELRHVWHPTLEELQKAERILDRIIKDTGTEELPF